MGKLLGTVMTKTQWKQLMIRMALSEFLDEFEDVGLNAANSEFMQAWIDDLKIQIQCTTSICVLILLQSLMTMEQFHEANPLSDQNDPCPQLKLSGIRGKNITLASLFNNTVEL